MDYSNFLSIHSLHFSIFDLTSSSLLRSPSSSQYRELSLCWNYNDWRVANSTASPKAGSTTYTNSSGSWCIGPWLWRNSSSKRWSYWENVSRNIRSWFCYYYYFDCNLCTNEWVLFISNTFSERVEALNQITDKIDEKVPMDVIQWV